MHLSVYSQYGINLTQSLTSSFVSRIDPSCTEIHLNNNFLFCSSFHYGIMFGLGQCFESSSSYHSFDQMPTHVAVTGSAGQILLFFSFTL